MTTISLRRSIRTAVLGGATAAWAGGAEAADLPVRLEVDAPDAPRKLTQAGLTIPAARGVMTPLDPKAGLPIERDPTRPDLLTQIVRPLAAAAPAARK